MTAKQLREVLKFVPDDARIMINNSNFVPSSVKWGSRCVYRDESGGEMYILVPTGTHLPYDIIKLKSKEE